MKIILYMASTLNGIIAKKDNSVDFVSKKSWASYQKTVKNCGCAIVGGKTYRLMPKSEFVSNCLYIVFTRKKMKKKTSNLFFASGYPKDVLRFLEKKGIKKVCLCGGAEINSIFLKHKLVNEIFLVSYPELMSFVK